MDLWKGVFARRRSASIKGNLLRRRRHLTPPMFLPSPSLLLLFAAAAPLAAWFLILTMKPTPLWKSWWRGAVAWAAPRLLRDSGLYALVFTFPPLLSAATAYLYLHLRSRKRRRRVQQYPLFRPTMSNPVLVLSSIGMVSMFELLAGALMAGLLVWTFCWGLAGDFNKPTPEKLLRLNLSSLQVKIMKAGIRLGSMAEICLAFLFFPVLRRLAVLKIAGVQFESAVRYHVWIGNLLILTAAAHGGAAVSVWASKSILLSELTKWPKTGKVNLAGAIDLLIGLTIWVSSLPAIRRKNFQLFYTVHHLHVAFVVFFLLHAGAHHFYLVSAGVLLFGVDFFSRVNLSRPATSVISVKVLPCRVIELTLSIKGVDYAPTSFMFVNVPAISKFQWHPFSIISSSAVDRDRVSFLIKCQGRWTGSLYEKIKSMKPFSVSVEGPYGPPSPPYARYEALVMVAGGSGITPFLSVLREVSDEREWSPARIGLVYAVKKVEEVAMLSSVSQLLLKKKKSLRVKIFVTGERKPFPGGSAGELIQAASQASTVIIGEESSPAASFYSVSSLGFREMAAAASFSFIVFLVSLVALSGGFISLPVSELFVLASFTAAVAGGAAMAVVLSRRKSKGRRRSYGGETQSENEEGEDVEIIFGQRPDLEDEVEDMCRKLGGSEFGVFVCGPAAMKETVGKLCRTRGSKEMGHDRYLSLAFHPINFSL